MKKNYLSRIGAFLLMSTMITSCFVGSTFAKYTSQGEGGDTARVAKWGVEVVVEGDNLFSNSYSKDDLNSKIVGDTVVSSEAVVAPGTRGTFNKISITGTPEVAVKVTATPELALTNWRVNGEEYCPIEFTIGEEVISGLDYGKTQGGIGSFETKVESAIKDAISGEFAAGTDLSIINEDIAISWRWLFEDDTGTGYNQDNEKDTALGDAAAAATGTGTAPTIKLDLGITVEQVD